MSLSEILGSDKDVPTIVVLVIIWCIGIVATALPLLYNKFLKPLLEKNDQSNLEVINQIHSKLDAIIESECCDDVVKVKLILKEVYKLLDEIHSAITNTQKNETTKNHEYDRESLIRLKSLMDELNKEHEKDDVKSRIEEY